MRLQLDPDYIKDHMKEIQDNIDYIKEHRDSFANETLLDSIKHKTQFVINYINKREVEHSAALKELEKDMFIFRSGNV